jgi:hypothetical protein
VGIQLRYRYYNFTFRVGSGSPPYR